MTHILALDQGTTSSRAVVFDAAGAPVASAQHELTQHYPKPGWVEHDANEIWNSQFDDAASNTRYKMSQMKHVAMRNAFLRHGHHHSC